MTLAATLLALAVLCGLWAGVSAVLIASALERHGVTTPLPLLGLFIVRNLHRYSELTRSTSGRIGPLFYSCVVPINTALILVVAALVAWRSGL